ncbi:MAG: hypothetical protein HYW78_04300 [Parcubacteria group bacterium]|nr:hypothetical protein [Parcubacteria group bacterium]
MRTLIGPLIIIAGVIMVFKSEWFLRTFGRVAWAEKNLGLEGGTRFFYKLLGLLVVLFGILIFTGLWNDLLNSFAGLFIR